MENAGKSVAQFIQSRFPNLQRRLVMVLCGKGNNGGDGFVVARQLLKGRKPEALLVGDPREMKGDAATNVKRWKNARASSISQAGEDQLRSQIAIIVDALLGTGVRGPVEGRLVR